MVFRLYSGRNQGGGGGEGEREREKVGEKRGSPSFFVQLFLASPPPPPSSTITYVRVLVSKEPVLLLRWGVETNIRFYQLS